MRLAPLAGLSLCLVLTSCSTSPTAPGIASPTTPGAGITGLVHGGQQVVVGTTVQLYAVGSGGDGSVSVPLLTKTVKSGNDGTFNITGLYTCPTPQTLVYLAGTSGNPGSGTNNNLAMMTVLGECGSLNSSTYVVMNEISTVTTIFTLAPYMTAYDHIGYGSDISALTAAFTKVTQLVDISTGDAGGTNPPAGSAADIEEINTLANIMAACINSTGGTAGDNSACGTLFSLAGGTGTVDTVKALLNVATTPSANLTALFNLSSATSPFQPQLSTPPTTSWVVDLFPMAATPVISPATGTVFTGSQSITIADSTPGSTIYYTTNGTVPTINSTRYTGAFNLTAPATTTVNAIAAATSYSDSPIASSTYSVSFSTSAGTAISSVTAIAATKNQTITITGVGFGTMAPYTGNSNFIYLHDVTAGNWSAGYGEDAVGLNITSWSDTQIVISGFTNSYGGSWVLSNGDQLNLQIWDASTGTGPAFCATMVVGAGPSNCSTSLPLTSPSISPAGGTYSSAQSVTLTGASGTAIHYTTDGSTPTTSSTLYTAPITVSASERLEAIATETGNTTSAPAIADYTITLPPAATPTFTIVPNTYTSAQTVGILDATPGAVIHYTTDGSTPTTSSTVYFAPLTVSSTETIQAIATEISYSPSPVAAGLYTITLPAAAPTFSVAAGTYTTTQLLSLSSTTVGAAIHYTTDNSTPTASSPLYTGLITISQSETIKAVALESGYSTSAVSSASYILNLPLAAAPTFSPSPGTYTSIQQIALASTTPGATIYYTTNGSTPSTTSGRYIGPITVSSSETIEAITVETNYSTSSPTSAAYTINLPQVATPTFSVAAGTYGSTQSVSLASSTPGATIHYTTDGSTPSTSSLTYTSPISVPQSLTITAYAVEYGYTDSAVTSAAYTIAATTATGIVNAGLTQPVVGSHVYMYAAGAGTSASSLLTAQTGGAYPTTQDANGHYYVTTDAQGGFGLSGAYVCTPGSQVYLYATGGNPDAPDGTAGPGDNSAIGMMTVLGACPASGSFDQTLPSVTINEVTTVAAAYALAGLTSGSSVQSVQSSGTPLALVGMANAFANAPDLVDPVAGVALTASPTGGTVSTSTINTIANILAACVGSAGPTSTACTNLNLSENEDTAGAVISWANQSASMPVSPLTTPFTPSGAASAPLPDGVAGAYIVGISYPVSTQGSGLSIAVDAAGNVWMDQITGAIEVSPTGQLLSPSAGYSYGTPTNSFLAYSGIAIDPSGNVWTASRNVGYPAMLAEISNSGEILSGAGYSGGALVQPSDIAIDGSGKVWVLESSENRLNEFDQYGNTLSGTNGLTGGGMSSPNTMAIDPSGNVWVANLNDTFSEFNATGALSGSKGYTETYADEVPNNYGIAVDGSGDVWLASAAELDQSTDFASRYTNKGVQTLLGGSFAGYLYTTGEIGGPGARPLVIDGRGNALVLGNPGFSEINPTTGRLTTLGSNGTVFSGYLYGNTLAVDGSGCVWTNAEGHFTQVFGLAAPVVTPVSAAVAGKKLGQRP